MKTKSHPTYVTLRVIRPLSKEELEHLKSIDSPTHQRWERDRQSMLFEIAVLADTEADAVKQLRTLLRSPKLIIERRRNGVSKNVQKVPSPKPKD